MNSASKDDGSETSVCQTRHVRSIFIICSIFNLTHKHTIFLHELIKIRNEDVIQGILNPCFTFHGGLPCASPQAAYQHPPGKLFPVLPTHEFALPPVGTRPQEPICKIRLVLQEANRGGAKLPLSSLYLDLLEQAEKSGLGELDNSAMLRLMESLVDQEP